jgi:hypothetical protein
MVLGLKAGKKLSKICTLGGRQIEHFGRLFDGFREANES